MVGVLKGTSNRSKGAGQLMIAIIFMALAAGCTSALMFASIISGALLSLLLCYLAPLPLLVAALGWGPACAAIGGIAAAAGLAGIFGFAYGAAFAITVALPAFWLGHLALLGRPIALDASSHPGVSGVPAAVNDDLEWYPVGRILLWIAGFATLSTIAALLTLGSDAASITNMLRRGLLRLFEPRETPLSDDAEHWVDALVSLAPAAGVAVALMTLTLNLWLSAKITATSGQLRRPWPDLRGTTLPPMTLPALFIAIAFCFTGGLFAMFAQIITAALMMAYALVGFAVLHLLTLPMKSRPFWLGTTYAIVVVFGWPILALVALGLADALFDIRRRYRRGKPPPLPVS
jgi:hypothetical protein